MHGIMHDIMHGIMHEIMHGIMQKIMNGMMLMAEISLYMRLSHNQSITSLLFLQHSKVKVVVTRKETQKYM